MNSADLVAELRFQGRYASETQQECTERKNNERVRAADRIVALEAWKAEAMEALRPLAVRCDETVRPDDTDRDGVTVKTSILRAARRLVEQEDGRDATA